MRVARAVELNADQRTTLEQWSRGRSLPSAPSGTGAHRDAGGRGTRRQHRGEVGDHEPEGRPLACAVHRRRTRWAGIGRAVSGPRAEHCRLHREIRDSEDHARPALQCHALVNANDGPEAGISEASVRRIWKANGLKPHLVETFKISNDPEFAENWKPSWVCISTRRNTRWYCAATKGSRR